MGLQNLNFACGSVQTKRGPLVSTIEELIGRKSRGCGLESRAYGRRDVKTKATELLVIFLLGPEHSEQ
jgi:hypothetical protein